MSSLAGESLACGHLGMIRGDADASKACTERQLALADTLHDHRGKEDAFLQLGGLAHESHDYGAARDHYLQACARLRAAPPRRHAHAPLLVPARSPVQRRTSRTIAVITMRVWQALEVASGPLQDPEGSDLAKVLSGVAGGLMEFENFVSEAAKS